MDGQRAIYDGKSTIYSRNINAKTGILNVINAPKFFTAKFPKGLVLDGELYTKKQDFEGTGIFRKKIPVESKWKKAIYMIFDIPLVRKPFKERYQLMKELLKDIPYIKVVKQIKVKDVDHMNKIHFNLVKQGCEGTMLRDPDSFYENKRSKTLLKIKDYFDS